jgi:crotonobetainyl-CoA:carnitine CoA-transferase CaiB-like acyl-CoA transferase
MEALQEVRVLDLSTGVTGPIVGMFLADFGATVVKVEVPEGDHARDDPGFATWNRGKRGVVIDPSDPTALAWLATQAAGADVLVTNGSEQLGRFGLDSDALLRTNSRLILTEVPPYLRGYTPWAGGHESGELLSALGGKSARQYSDSGDPAASVYPTVLYVQGLWATVCTVAALVEREGSGWGQRVTVTGINGFQQLWVDGQDPDGSDSNTALSASGRRPLYTRLLAGDGKWFGLGALGAKFESAVLDVLELRGLLSEERMGGRVENLNAPDNYKWGHKVVGEAALKKPRAEWLEILDSLGVPCGPLDDRDEWLDHPQIRAIGMRVEVDDPERGAVIMPGVPLNLTATPGLVQGPAPMLGQHDGKVPTWDPQPSAEGRPPVRPGPLHGYTILNSGWFLAVPYAGMLLAQLGANVVKVEAPTPDWFRGNGYFYNRGMTSLVLDLQSPKGVAAFNRVVEHADAFVDGLRPGVTKRLGIDYDSLVKINPAIVTASLSGYGEGGPLSERGGFDMVIQAMSGMMKAEGGEDEPVANALAVCDRTTSACSDRTGPTDLGGISGHRVLPPERRAHQIRGTATVSRRQQGLQGSRAVRQDLPHRGWLDPGRCRSRC